MEIERQHLLALAADFLMENGETDSTREMLIEFLDNPANADTLEAIRRELIMDERISGEVLLEDLLLLDLPDDDLEGSRLTVPPPMGKPSAWRRALAWCIRRIVRIGLMR